MEGLPEKHKTTTKPPCVPLPTILPAQRAEEHIYVDTDTAKVDTKSGTVLELPSRPWEAMQDEDGYMALNIKDPKPAVASGENAQSQTFRNK